MPERTVKRRLEEAGDAALAADGGPIFSTIAKLVEAPHTFHPRGIWKRRAKKEALRLGRELLRGTRYEEER